MFGLGGRRALVTGSSRGIGYGIAAALAGAGAEVLLNGRDQAALGAAAARLADAGATVRALAFDVTSEESVEEAVSYAEAEIGPIDILVNNAGIQHRAPLEDFPLEKFEQVMRTNVTSAFMVGRAVARGMIARRSGKIINICSMMSELGRETVSAYAAAKGGLKMLTRNICSEYGQYNIQCNGIGPGYIATPQTAPLREKQADGTMHPFDSFIRAKTPANRWGEAEDLIGPAVFLASDASDFVNGHILYVDGGILAYIGKQPQ